jgi:hypothetical protein
MPYSTEMKNKMYLYREKNKDNYKEYQRNYQFENYDKYKEKTLERKKQYYIVKKEFRIFLNILLD